MNQVTKKITINGIPYTIHITKWMGKEWKLSVLEARNIKDVFHHSPEQCIKSLKLQLEAQNKKMEVVS